MKRLRLRMVFLGISLSIILGCRNEPVGPHHWETGVIPNGELCGDHEECYGEYATIHQAQNAADKLVNEGRFECPDAALSKQEPE